MLYSKIIGTGGGLPRKCVSNTELEERIDTSDAWIYSRTGIRQRYLSDKDETTCTLAEIACREALRAAAIEPSQIDLTIVATATPDQAFPSTACLLQERLGIDRAGGAFDVQAACSGFLYALDIADRFVRSKGAETVLVVGADVLSKLVDWTDRSTCVLFGDGAGAVVVQAASEEGIVDSRLRADGRYHHLLEVVRAPGGGAGHIHMEGSEVFKLAVRYLERVAREILQENQLTIDAVDWLVPHQANTRIIDTVARKLQLPSGRIISTIDQHGNTSAASIPMALDLAIRGGRIRQGDLLLLAAFGGGITWGATLVKY